MNLINTFVNLEHKSSSFIESVILNLHPKSALRDPDNPFRQIFEQLICVQVDNFFLNDVIKERYNDTSEDWLDLYAKDYDIERPLYSFYDKKPINNELFRDYIKKYKRRNNILKTLRDYQYDLLITNTPYVDIFEEIDFLTVNFNQFREFDLKFENNKIQIPPVNYYTHNNNVNLNLIIKDYSIDIPSPIISVVTQFKYAYITVENISFEFYEIYTHFYFFIKIRDINYNTIDPGYFNCYLTLNGEPIDLDIIDNYIDTIRIDFDLPLDYDEKNIVFKLEVKNPISQYYGFDNSLTYNILSKIDYAGNEENYISMLHDLYKNMFFPVDVFMYEKRSLNIYSENNNLSTQQDFTRIFHNFNIDCDVFLKPEPLTGNLTDIYLDEELFNLKNLYFNYHCYDGNFIPILNRKPSKLTLDISRDGDTLYINQTSQLTDENGNPISNAEIIISINNKYVTTLKTNTTGFYQFYTSILDTDTTIKAVFEGNNNYEYVEIEKQIPKKPLPPQDGNLNVTIIKMPGGLHKAIIWVQLVDDNGLPSPNWDVYITLNDILISDEGQKTNEQGSSSVTVLIPSGKAIVEVIVVNDAFDVAYEWNGDISSYY